MGSESHARGYRNGWLDSQLGTCTIISLTAPDPEYGAGYQRGQIDYREGRRNGAPFHNPADAAIERGLSYKC